MYEMPSYKQCFNLSVLKLTIFSLRMFPVKVRACVIRVLIDGNIMIKIKIYFSFASLGLDIGSHQVNHIFAGF